MKHNIRKICIALAVLSLVALSYLVTVLVHGEQPDARDTYLLLIIGPIAILIAALAATEWGRPKRKDATRGWRSGR